MDPEIKQYLEKGLVIPALPLALNENKRIDERYQRALLRYYVASGAGGIAAAVHTTQFKIRDPDINLFHPVLRLVRDVLNDELSKRDEPFVRIAGVCGPQTQAIQEAETAASLGYDIVLLSLGALRDAPIDALLGHCRTISAIIPVMGFYLQPAVGGRILPYDFWRGLFEIDNVVAVKIAPFNRYHTFDVVRALAESGREDEIVLYTGNDDNIINDLITPFPVRIGDQEKIIRIKGGLLGQWSVWTSAAVRLHSTIREYIENGSMNYAEFLSQNIALTDANGALFDVRNNFKGCIAGINYVLFRQGLMRNFHCLDESDSLSPGQSDEIDRVLDSYAWLRDDDFVLEHIDTWLK
jgi:dihydrodipicolinate synthase/N-acetylneuraminate lyase